MCPRTETALPFLDGIFIDKIDIYSAVVYFYDQPCEILLIILDYMGFLLHQLLLT
jgi:hypothetical protein